MIKLPRIPVRRFLPRFWTFSAYWHGALVLLALGAIVLDGVAPDAPGTRVLVSSGMLGGAIGFWIAAARIAVRHRQEERMMARLPRDINLHHAEDGSVSGIVRMGNDDLIGITIPPEVMAEYDPEREQTMGLLFAYAIEQIVPADIREKLNMPTIDAVRASLQEREEE